MGRRRKRKPLFSEQRRTTVGGAVRSGILKGFHAPQKDNSLRQKRKAGLNDYTQDKKEDR